MKDGRIKEEGTHEVLMADDNGEYSNLIKSFHDAEEKEMVQEVDASSVVGMLFQDIFYWVLINYNLFLFIW